MELLVAICLIFAGLAIGLMGLKLFRILLPIAGLVSGAVIGFSGFQGIFGTGVTSTTIAILVAIVFGLVLAFLSYTFFDIAVNILVALSFSSLFTLLGISLGLSANGFIVTMLSISGFIIGLMIASSSIFLAESVVSFVTAFIGSGFILGGIFLLSSGVTMQSLHDDGVLMSVAHRVNNSFLWLLIWIASTVVLRYTQLSAFVNELFTSEYTYKKVVTEKAQK